ncbi:MAG: class I SAM-dependent methyltransferase, partial [Desulfobacteraceae bacterium]|nr:class I SAM-dependent methyltransferase [Desulfobacteraceae bacterium]
QSMPEIIDRKEGRGLFGADPNNYNEIRPPYPEQIYEFLLTTGALHADTATLEIGAGNGLATRRLLDLGAHPLTIIEPDPGFGQLLASLSAGSKAEICCMEGSFEEAELPVGHYDLVAAATSFHWIQPAIGLAKIARVLKPGGHVAIWWNQFGDTEREDPFHDATRTILRPLAISPSGEPDTVPFALAIPARLRDFAGTGQFETPEYRAYPWTLVLNTEQVGALYATFSSINRLPEEQRKSILDQLMEVAERQFGGRVEKNMVSPIYLARRKTFAA